nr:hypothetical protein [Mycobacterium riyadhense]
MHPECGEVFGRQVYPSRAAVCADILPEIKKPQRRRHPIREFGRGRRVLTEDVKNKPAYRLSRESAVAEQLIECLITGDPLIGQTGLDKPIERFRAQAVGPDDRRQRPQSRSLGGVPIPDAVQIGVKIAQGRRAVAS